MQIVPQLHENDYISFSPKGMIEEYEPNDYRMGLEYMRTMKKENNSDN